MLIQKNVTASDSKDEGMSSDDNYTKLLPGTYTSSKQSTNYGAEALTQFNSDKTFTFSATMSMTGQTGEKTEMSFSGNGKWEINNGYLIETVENVECDELEIKQSMLQERVTKDKKIGRAHV